MLCNLENDIENVIYFPFIYCLIEPYLTCPPYVIDNYIMS